MEKPNKDQSSEQEKKAKKRADVLNEIVKSEALYANFLSGIVNDFQHPLEQQHAISKEQSKALFANVASLAQLHEQLNGDISKSGTQDNGKKIVDCFKQFCDFLRLYTIYVNNYQNSLSALNELNTNAKATLAELEEKQEGLRLRDLLIMPIQRIPRYRMLLEELRKFTLEGTEELQELNAVLVKVQEVAKYVNESARAAGVFAEVAAIQLQVHGLSEPLIQPHRVLIKSGEMTRYKNFSQMSLVGKTKYKLNKRGGSLKESGSVASKTGKLKQVYVYLFNDMIMWTTTGETKKLIDTMKLAGCVIRPFDADSFNIISLKDENKDCTLTLLYGKTKNNWFETIEDAIEEAKVAWQQLRLRKYEKMLNTHQHHRDKLQELKMKSQSDLHLDDADLDSDFESTSTRPISRTNSQIGRRHRRNNYDPLYSVQDHILFPANDPDDYSSI